jgi:nucleotide-binding universal stress UspA family protein
VAVLRSILVALDDTRASSQAQQLAIEMAKRLDCQITGLAILDRAHITSPTPVGIGGMAFKQHRDQVKLKEAKSFLQRVEKGFEQSSESVGVAWQVIEAEGVPHKLIEQESGRHDLLVIGKDTDFHFDAEPSVADTVQRLLRENSRPLLVCPEQASSEGPILATYDGSVRASRALHMFMLLGHARGRPVRVLSVADDQQAADAQARYLTELFAKHGYQATPHGVGSHADPADIVLAEAEALGATLIAMGASGHRPLHDFFLGSTTQRVLNACPCVLFVHR